MTTSKTPNTPQLPNSHGCERHEADLSAILDGELSTVDLTSTLDHLVSCSSCAAFYRRSRELDRAVAEARSEPLGGVDDSDPAIEPSAEVWRRISEQAPWSEGGRDRAREASHFRPRRQTLVEWAPRLAAAFVLAFGLWMAHLVTRDAGSGALFQQASEASVDVLSEDELSESRIETESTADSSDLSEMDEERFVALASEVLKADPKYHYEMLDVMKTATRVGAREGSVDYRRGDEAFSLTGSRGEGDRTSDGRVWQ